MRKIPESGIFCYILFFMGHLMMILPVERKDREQIDAFIIRQWYTLQMVVHGESIDLGTADGFFASEEGRITGLITFRSAPGGARF